MTVYSERFLILEQPQTWASITIPPDTRAVIRAIDAHNAAGVAGLVQVAVATTIIFHLTFTATHSSVHIDTRQVLYPGEVLAGFVEAAGMVLMISGYLFREAGARRLGPPFFTQQLPGMQSPTESPLLSSGPPPAWDVGS